MTPKIKTDLKTAAAAAVIFAVLFVPFLLDLPGGKIPLLLFAFLGIERIVIAFHRIQQQKRPTSGN